MIAKNSGFAGLLFLALAMFAGPSAAADGPLLHAMFQDHAVLQRDKPINVYGVAPKGAAVSVTLNGVTGQATADDRGHWLATLPAMGAGGPYTLTATAGGVSQTVNDVLIGDVLLCTGQSNMQLAVRAAADAALEMRAATDNQIRQFTIATHESLTPLDSFADPTQWTVESPDTAGNFSASCFYMARELKKTTHVPIGMVVSAWGGSRVRAWISEGALRSLGYFNDDLDMFDLYQTDPQAAQRHWDAKWEAWWRSQPHPPGEPWSVSYPANDWAVAPPTLGAWARWTGTSPDGFVGQMWLRTTVSLTAAQAAQPAMLDLGAVNEEDESWVNGQGVGGTSWSQHARHDIPAGVLHAGDNVIVTNIFCSWRNCGMSGPAENRAIRFKDGSAALLSNPWRYAQAPDDLIAPQIPWGPTHGVAMDYNGMIAPVGPYGFKTAVWYQGESNIYFAEHYQTSLMAMMADWRKLFGADLPFLIVEIPDYGPIPTKPVASGWSDVREAQRRAALADKHSGYIVTIDIGEPLVLHPTNKQEVGRRLALAARAVVYGEKISYAGPMPGHAKAEKGKVVVPFGDVTGRLVSYSGNPNAFELCGASQASCSFADAHIKGDSVELTGGAGATRVRYCWGDSPICTLSDGSGLPTTPFELTITHSEQ